MRFFYHSGLLAYYFAIKLSSFFGKEKATLWLKGRQDWRKKLRHALSKNKTTYWFHVASLGEFEQARPLIENLQSPDHFIILTFFSPSGYEIRKDYKHADYVCYLPLDTTKNAKDFISILKPDFAIFIKYEFWFNYLQELKEKKVSTYLVCGIFRPDQHFFKWYGGWFRKRLSAFSFFYLQNEQSKKLLSDIGFENTAVTGDTRFDRVVKAAEENFDDFRFTSFTKNAKVIVFGSSWKEEENFALYLHNNYPQYKIIIAPHEIEKERMVQLKSRFKKQALLYSNTQQNEDLSNSKVLIVDAIGLLSKIYRFAYVTVIGGGFGKGIHNILEAAVYGKPIIIGPRFKKFQEAVDLVSLGGAHTYNDYTKAVDSLILNESKVKRSAQVTEKYVMAQAGATEKISGELGT